MHDALLVFPHQLFPHLPETGQCRHAVLVEEPLFHTQYRFHRARLVHQRASLRWYGHWLQQQQWTVDYVESGAAADVRNLLPQLAARGCRRLFVSDVCDDWLQRRLTASATATGIDLCWRETPQFLTPAATLATLFRSDRKRYLQQNFYQAQRRRLGILLDPVGQPLGGKWSFDADNRKPWPRKRLPPQAPLAEATPWHREAEHWVTRHFPDAPGATESTLRLPVTHEAANTWLEQFLEERLTGFGTFEDAIVAEAGVLHHSVLTPLLNNGLLLPETVLQCTLAFAAERCVPLNDLEGFLRQLIGWREFVRGLYVHHGRQQRCANHWGFTRPLPPAFYTASTDIAPVDATIRKVLQSGYCHHIERLMLLGCFMLLCECHPDGVYRWFMELFIDAWDWVMVPNVYGMSQFADGGLMATKPYICGSNYVLKMSNFARGPWCQTWDALFWRFVYRHGSELRRNPRLALLVRNIEQRPESQRRALLAHADAYLQQLHACSGQGDPAV